MTKCILPNLYSLEFVKGIIARKSSVIMTLVNELILPVGNSSGENIGTHDYQANPPVAILHLVNQQHT